MDTKEPKPFHVKRPWGEFIQFVCNTLSTVKIITINPGEILSLQYHEKRDEFWRVVSGNGFATVGESRTPISAGDEKFVTHTTKHRLEAGDVPLVILEISLGDFDENDITRLEDQYGRSSA